MKLSEAIRLGATMKPQAFGEYFVNGGTCALGSAMDAIGEDPRFWDESLFSLPEMKGYHCPILGCNRQQTRIDYMVMHLNDDEEWTREQIADWVELQEPIDSTSPPEELPDPIPAPEEEPSKVA